jgi:hypothetical protein
MTNCNAAVRRALSRPPYVPSLLAFEPVIPNLYALGVKFVPSQDEDLDALDIYGGTLCALLLGEREVATEDGSARVMRVVAQAVLASPKISVVVGLPAPSADVPLSLRALSAGTQAVLHYALSKIIHTGALGPQSSRWLKCSGGAEGLQHRKEFIKVLKAVAIIRSGLTAGPLYDSGDAAVKTEWEEAIGILASPEGGGGGGDGGGASDSETEF